MAVEAKDFFSGEYLEFARAIDREDISAMRETSKRIDLNTKIGEKQMTVFVYAVAAKKIKAMQELVRLGANPELVVPGVGAPLSLAAAAEDSKILAALLDAGCDPNARIDDEPLLFAAQRHDRMANIDLLIEKGASVNAADSAGNTVLTEAIYSMHFDTAIRLIAHGSDVFAKTDNGLSVAYIAQRAKDRMQPESPGAEKVERIIELMKSRGVKFPAAPPPKP
jgi:ankyrin repeat protein